MTTASFLTFATLLVLMTLSWSQPGEAAPTSDHSNPERAAGWPIVGRIANRWRKRPCARIKQFCHDHLPCCSTDHECREAYHIPGTFHQNSNQITKQCVPYIHVWRTKPNTIFKGNGNGRYAPGSWPPLVPGSGVRYPLPAPAQHFAGAQIPMRNGNGE